MIVKCIYNDPNDLPLGISTDFHFGLEKGEEFFVMGIVQTKDSIWYLIDINKKPYFFPYQIFEIIDHSIPDKWFYKVYKEDNGIYPFEKLAMLSFEEMCFEENYCEDLIINRNPDSLKKYFNIKKELSYE